MGGMRLRFFAALAALLLLCGCGEDISGAAVRGAGGVRKEPPGVADTAEAQPPPFRYARSFLTPEERAFYDALAAAAEGEGDALSARIDLPPGMGEESFRRVARGFSDDNPGFYWAVPALEPGGARARLALPEGLTESQLGERRRELEAAASAILDGLARDGGMDYVTAVHDRMVERLNYDGSTRRSDNDNPYGGLVNRWAVCDGYARTFQYLMQLGGVDCVYFQGESLTGLPHAWNAVRLEGEWYYVDVTWDATDPFRRRIYHDYLGMTLEEALRERRFAAGQYPALPQAEAAACNYYRYYGCGVDPVFGEEIARIAEAFANGLERAAIPEELSPVYLEAKVFAPPEEYARVKALFIRELSAVARETEELARQRGLPVELETGGKLECGFRDGQQVLILLPRAARRAEAPPGEETIGEWRG